jgi:hypothetical protein
MPCLLLSALSSSFVMMEEHEAKGLVLKDLYVKSSLALP